MHFLKQFLILFIVIVMYLCAFNVQSSGEALHGMGFISVLMVLLCLYIILKLLWNNKGTIVTVAIFAAVAVYGAYASGIFKGKAPAEEAASEPQETAQVAENDDMSEEADDLEIMLFGGDVDDESEKDSEETENKPSQKENAPLPQPKNTRQAENNMQPEGGLVGKLRDVLFGAQPVQQTQAGPRELNPFDYPATTGYAKVVTASTLYMNGLHIKMFGIDAPDITQTCANRRGAGYYCGKEARKWLQNWLNNREVSCHRLREVANGWAIGVCFVDDAKYDVAAVVVNAGWAVAYTQDTAVYTDYEKQARANRRGLWAGTFYKPWDWRKIQNRKVKIKINYQAPQPASQNKTNNFDFWGLF